MCSAIQPSRSISPESLLAEAPLTFAVLERPQLALRHAPFCRPQSDAARDLFRRLEQELVYQSAADSRVRVFNRWHDLPRQQAAYGDSGVHYTYSGRRLSASPWTPTLRAIRDRLTREVGVEYNFALVNRYRDGRDKMGEHRDDERELDSGAPIASLSLGAERDFYFKHAKYRSGEDKSNRLLLKLKLRDGMLLLMDPPTNQHWYHALPPRKRCQLPRINLTFRKITQLKSDE